MKFFHFKKRAFTLIEIMISMSLVSILLTFLAYTYYEINLLNIFTEKTEKKAFQLRYLENRLYQIIPNVLSSKNRDHIFFSSHSCENFLKSGNPYLIFSFDNAINIIDSNFSNHVIGRLFLDREGKLILTIMPNVEKLELKDNIPISKEVLMENVKSLNFSFFSWNQKSEEQNENMLQKGEWVSYWKQEYQQLPALLKIKLIYLDQKEEKIREMVFPLMNGKYKITYG